jgi:hypothetical protein
MQLGAVCDNFVGSFQTHAPSLLQYQSSCNSCKRAGTITAVHPYDMPPAVVPHLAVPETAAAGLGMTVELSRATEQHPVALPAEDDAKPEHTQVPPGIFTNAKGNLKVRLPLARLCPPHDARQYKELTGCRPRAVCCVRLPAPLLLVVPGVPRCDSDDNLSHVSYSPPFVCDLRSEFLVLSSNKCFWQGDSRKVHRSPRGGVCRHLHQCRTVRHDGFTLNQDGFFRGAMHGAHVLHSSFLCLLSLPVLTLSFDGVRCAAACMQGRGRPVERKQRRDQPGRRR